MPSRVLSKFWIVCGPGVGKAAMQRVGATTAVVTMERPNGITQGVATSAIIALESGVALDAHQGWERVQVHMMVVVGRNLHTIIRLKDKFLIIWGADF
jgi:hypothetical protein